MAPFAPAIQAQVRRQNQSFLRAQAKTRGRCCRRCCGFARRCRDADVSAAQRTVAALDRGRTLPAGTTLPAERQLAESLGVSRATVQRFYHNIASPPSLKCARTPRVYRPGSEPQPAARNGSPQRIHRRDARTGARALVGDPGAGRCERSLNRIDLQVAVDGAVFQTRTGAPRRWNSRIA